ncbi:MAG: DUF6477 family protein [Brevirhabdus sp.]
MQSSSSVLSKIKRPRLLIRAARFGLLEYRRERDLKRLLRVDRLAGPERNLARLLGEEAQLEEERRSQDAGYSVPRHIEMLVALIAEARLLRATGAP